MDHRFLVPPAGRAPASLPEVPPGDPTAFHRTLPGYRPTPLLDVPSLARRAGVARVLVKDEAERLGLPAFKMLGASWATARAVRRHWTGPDVPLDVQLLRTALAAGPPRRLAAATDGNHGRGVARMAALLGIGCTIYVPEGTAPARVHDIEQEGATVTVVEGSYDDAIVRSAQDADDATLVISDTSWPGYTETPTDVIHGYATMFREVDATLADHGATPPTHLFLQAGVGSFAAAGLLHHARGDRPGAGPDERRTRGVVVEPTRADCLMRSAEAGRVTEAPPPHRSSMAGLNCGLPSLLAWPVVHALAEAYVSIDDDLAHEAMRALAAVGVVAGESGAASLAGLLAVADSSEERAALGLDETSVVLLVNTEGATDPVNYEHQVGEAPAATERRSLKRRGTSGVAVLA